MLEFVVFLVHYLLEKRIKIDTLLFYSYHKQLSRSFSFLAFIEIFNSNYVFWIFLVLCKNSLLTRGARVLIKRKSVSDGRSLIGLLHNDFL